MMEKLKARRRASTVSPISFLWTINCSTDHGWSTVWEPTGLYIARPTAPSKYKEASTLMVLVPNPNTAAWKRIWNTDLEETP